MHIISIAVPFILLGLKLYVRLLRYLNYHTQNIPFFTDCGHRNYLECPYI